MSERQYNSKLLNDKLSEIPIKPNELLWAQLEAQLTAVPSAHQVETTDGALTEVTKTVSKKLVITVVASIVVLTAILFVLLRKPQNSVQPVTPPQEQPIEKVDSIKVDTTQTFETPLLPRFPIKKDTSTVTSVIPDTVKAEPVQIPLALPDNAEKLKIDSIKTVKLPIIVPSVDTTKSTTPRKKEEGYYFDVKKKEKKKKSSK